MSFNTNAKGLAAVTATGSFLFIVYSNVLNNDKFKTKYNYSLPSPEQPNITVTAKNIFEVLKYPKEFILDQKDLSRINELSDTQFYDQVCTHIDVGESLV